MALHSLRWLLVDRPGSLGERRRSQRARWLADTFPDLAEMSVIDLGGRPSTWMRAPVKPKRTQIKPQPAQQAAPSETMPEPQSGQATSR